MELDSKQRDGPGGPIVLLEVDLKELCSQRSGLLQMSLKEIFLYRLFDLSGKSLSRG